MNRSLTARLSRWATLGAVWSASWLVTTASAQLLNEDFKILSPDGSGVTTFGQAVAIDGNLVAVGASTFGRAYVFNATTGAGIATLNPNDPPSHSFGYAMALEGSVVAVGARWDDQTAADAGAVYLFDALSGTQLRKLRANDGALDDWMGYSVAMDGGIVAAGSPRDADNGNRSGSVYLFDAASGAQLNKIKPADGAAFDEFGQSVAMGGGLLVVGAWSDGDNGGGSGSAYIFDVATGAQLHKLLASDGGVTDYFGSSVAIDGGLVVVGAYSDLNNGGAAYLYDAATGAELDKFVASDIGNNDEAGYAVAISGGIVVVGAHKNDDAGSDSGSAYLFDAGTGVQLAKLLPTDGTAGARFGHSVAMQGSRILVGADLDDDFGFGSGSVYFFTAPGVGCPVDLTGDDAVDFFDILEFLSQFSAQTATADWNDDNAWDFFDVLGFLEDFAAGCP